MLKARNQEIGRIVAGCLALFLGIMAIVSPAAADVLEPSVPVRGENGFYVDSNAPENDKLEVDPDWITLGFLGEPSRMGEAEMQKLDAARDLLVDGVFGERFEGLFNAPGSSSYLGFRSTWEGMFPDYGNSGYFIEIELERPCLISSVTMDFLAGPGIAAPDGVELQISANRSEWRTAAPAEEPSRAPNNDSENLLYTMTPDSLLCRYLRVVFRRGTDGSGVSSVVCFDELTVHGSAVPAEENALELSPEDLSVALLGQINEHGQAALADQAQYLYLLTDGHRADRYDAMNQENGSYVGFDESWEGTYTPDARNFGWGNGGYSFTFDFTIEHLFNSVSIDFIVGLPGKDGRNAGFGGPEGLTISVSRDGRTWEELGPWKRIVSPAEGNFEKWLFQAEGSARGRYLRFSFRREQWTEDRVYPYVALDEITASGAAAPHVHDYGEPEYIWTEDYQCTLRRVCREDPTHIDEREMEVTSSILTEPTCYEDGSEVYTATLTLDGVTYQDTRTKVLPKLDHEYQGGFCIHCGAAEPHVHDYGEPEYIWTEDYQCTLRRVCREDPTHIDEREMEVTSSILAEPTCYEDGSEVYTATLTLDGVTYQDTRTKVLPKLDHEYQNGFCIHCGVAEPHVHDYGEPEYIWTEDYQCTLRRVCREDPTHIDEREMEVTSRVLSAPTCYKDGSEVYTATLTLDGVTYQDTRVRLLPRLRHAYENGFCIHCGEAAPTMPAPSDAVGPAEDDTPKTGDASPLALYLVAWTLAGIGATFCGISMKRRR